ncbi:type II toxin-antitoxin system VapC family toxin [Xanthobacter dioxanivorans]|uniref:type II toxin-antitoxin system VapC family toxin n=1 Tax=Xanthobacter dioxanivorans TaxID=2528964 RepID=UPI0038CD6EF7
MAFSPKMHEIACLAFDRFGKGRRPAGLNFGDCMAYAVAKAHDAPLLFKGDDFSRTDGRVLPV